jgi:hypothetical protein
MKLARGGYDPSIDAMSSASSSPDSSHGALQRLRSDLGAPKPKRVGPPTVTPVTLDGVRYEALHWGRERGLGQNGGYVAAFDAARNEELWNAHIYVIDYLPKLETDVQDIFIRTLEAGANGHELLVTDELGRRFTFDIPGREATPLS